MFIVSMISKVILKSVMNNETIPQNIRNSILTNTAKPDPPRPYTFSNFQNIRKLWKCTLWTFNG